MNLTGAKVYSDGGHWIAIPHTERQSNRHDRKAKKRTDREQAFEQAFAKAKGKRNSRKAQLLQEFAPLFENGEEAAQFVERQFERLSRNRWERYKRMIRRAYIQQWDFFCTFTYDDRKLTEEQFRRKLLNCLYHLSNRKGWRYIGAWERGELGHRLHFHALIHIPPNGMIGELEEHNDYSTKQHRRKKSLQNSFFNERFGRSDFSPITNTSEVSESVKYMLKYISKNNERVVYSRGLKTYFISDISDEDILCRFGDEENGFKYILADNFTCIKDGEIMGEVSLEVIAKMPKSN